MNPAAGGRRPPRLMRSVSRTKSGEMIEVTTEPVGAVYEGLVGLAVKECSTFSLVMRPGLRFDASATRLTGEIAPHLVSELSASSWPGTQLAGGSAVVRHYRLNATTRDLLLTVPGLYAWLCPAYPEDLAFYLSDASVWLGSVAHERFAFFQTAAHSKAELQALVPGLQVRERWARSRRSERGG